MTVSRIIFLLSLLMTLHASAQGNEQTLTGWKLTDAAKVAASPAEISSSTYKADDWYTATVPGTVLTTLVNNKVYPEPLYGENMREIPESLNKTSYWYRTTFPVPSSYKGRHTWLHFAGINYFAEIGSTAYMKPGKTATLAVHVSPQLHPRVPARIKYRSANRGIS